MSVIAWMRDRLAWTGHTVPPVRLWVCPVCGAASAFELRVCPRCGGPMRCISERGVS